MQAPYTPDNYSLDESIGYRMSRARALMAASLDRALADQMSGAAVEALNHHLRDFSPDEVAQFKTFLRRMIANA